MGPEFWPFSSLITIIIIIIIIIDTVSKSETDDVTVWCVTLSCLKWSVTRSRVCVLFGAQVKPDEDSRLCRRPRVALIRGGGRPEARAEVNRSIMVRHAPVNCGLYCWSCAGQQLQTGFELPTDNNGAAVLLFLSLSPGEQASAPHWAAVKHHKAMLKSMSHAT